MTHDDTGDGKKTRGSTLGPVLIASSALGLFDALVTALGHRAALPGPALATLAAGAFLFDFGIALGMAAALLPIARLLLGRESVDSRLEAPWRLLSAALFRPREPSTAVALHRAWTMVCGLFPALAALALVTWASVAAFHEPVRTALFVAFAGLPAALLARAAGRTLWNRLVADPAVRGLGFPAWVGPVSALVLAGTPISAAIWSLANRGDVFGAIDPWPAAALAVFTAALGIAIAARGHLRPVRRAARRLAWASAAAAVAAVVGGAALLTTSAQVHIALRRGSGLAPVLHAAAAGLLDMDRDDHPFLLGGDCAPFDPAIHPLAEDVAGDGRDQDCDGIDGPPAAASWRDPLRAMAGTSPGERGGILLLVIDAARPDHLSLYGYDRPTTPNLVRFAGGSIVFEDFFAVSNHTALSLPAILTGRYPSTRPGVRNVNWHGTGIRAMEHPVATRLKAKGWQALFLPGHHMKGYLTGFNVRLPRGKGHEPARATVRRIMNALKRLGANPGKPALVGAHFMGPHHPYRAPERPDRFGTGPVDRYDAELAHVDEALAPLLELMESPGWDRWLVMITSDHGEAFHEHGTAHHGYTLHDEEIRVPLVLRVPGIDGRREATPAGHLDLAPTLMEWATGKVPRELPGASLLALAGRPPGGQPLGRLVFSESYRRGDAFSVRDGRRALILHSAPWLFELYDSAADPLHRHDLYAPDAERGLRAALVEHARRATAAIEKNEPR